MTQLPEILIKNSFNILGLSPSSPLKDIRKRSQQLLQLAKIEEMQEFTMDIGNVKELRSEGQIRLALEKVSAIQERIKEVFFWFEDHSIEDRNAIFLISKQKYQEAYEILKKDNKLNRDWIRYKNLSLALNFYAFATSNFVIFCSSLDLWKIIIESDDFWMFYKDYYLHYDELGTSSSFFDEFKNYISEIISDIALSFYYQTKNPKVIGYFYQVFSNIGKNINVQILEPIILKIRKKIEQLETISSDSVVNASSIQLTLEKINRYFKDIDNFELTEYSPLIVLKNDTVEKLRSISIDLYNRDHNYEIVHVFLDQLIKLASSETLINKIKSDKEQIANNQIWGKINKKFNNIKLLITNLELKKAHKTYLRLDNQFAKQSDESGRIVLLITYSSALTKKGHELFNKRKFGIKILAISAFLNRKTQKYAIRAFEQALEALKARISLLNFVDSSDSTDVLNTIDNINKSLKNCELESLLDEHDYYLDAMEKIANKQTNEESKLSIKLLGAAACFSILYRRYYQLERKKMWKTIIWSSVILYYFFVILPEKKPNTSNYPKPHSSLQKFDNKNENFKKNES